MRNPKTKRLVKPKSPSAYQKTLRATADQLPRSSKYLPGITAHDIADFSRRGVAESANSALRGDFVNLDGRRLNVFELGRINILLGFIIAGCNQRRIAAFRRAHELDESDELLAAPPIDPATVVSAGTRDDVAINSGDPPDQIRSSAG